MENDETSQSEEIEVLCSIYGESLALQPTSDRKCVEMQIGDAVFRLDFPPDYPSVSSPTYQVSAPFLTKHEKDDLDKQLQEILSSSVGIPVVYTLSECLRDFLETRQKQSKCGLPSKFNNPKTKEKADQLVKDLQPLKLSSMECPAILTGDCIEDRKSVFQGHYAPVQNMDEVKAVMAKLLENRKVANAYHNMFAYRIKQPGDGKIFLQDCDDDGETHAGGRMMHLLEILDCQNVLVVVSRWYGGIQLGPDRFKHINNAARNVLEIGGVVTKNKKDSSAGSSKSKGVKKK